MNTLNKRLLGIAAVSLLAACAQDNQSAIDSANTAPSRDSARAAQTNDANERAREEAARATAVRPSDPAAVPNSVPGSTMGTAGAPVDPAARTDSDMAATGSNYPSSAGSMSGEGRVPRSFDTDARRDNLGRSDNDVDRQRLLPRADRG